MRLIAIPDRKHWPDSRLGLNTAYIPGLCYLTRLREHGRLEFLPELLLLSRHGAARILWFILPVRIRSVTASADWNHSGSYEALPGDLMLFAFGAVCCAVLQDNHASTAHMQTAGAGLDAVMGFDMGIRISNLMTGQ